MAHTGTTPHAGATSPIPATYHGFATMYMRMPMSSSTLPIQGQCTVEDRRITLKFPFTGIEFDLPGPPREKRNDYDFTIRSQRGDMTMTIGFIEELKAFTGTGRMESGTEADEPPVLTFCFFAPESPLSRLPKI
jgi:hypothetical protein